MKLCGNTVPGRTQLCTAPAKYLYWRKGSPRKKTTCESCLRERRSRLAPGDKIFTRPIDGSPAPASAQA